jgi:hypothetical protein
MSQAFIGEFISPPTLRFLATNLHNKILQEYKNHAYQWRRCLAEEVIFSVEVGKFFP